MSVLQVIKIGGNIIDNAEALASFLDQFAEMENPRILVHGGGRKASDLSRRLGIEPKMVEGRRITDAESLEIVTMVYGGLINKNIVAMLQARGINALGMSGADLNLVPARKRKKGSVDFGFVGDFETSDIQAGQLYWLLDNGIIPVICALTHDGNGSLLNTNADTLASGIAIAIARKRPAELHLCFEKKGVLLDMRDEESIIPKLARSQFLRMKADGAVFEGMIPKLENAFSACEHGVQVIIRHALEQNSGTKLLNDD